MYDETIEVYTTGGVTHIQKRVTLTVTKKQCDISNVTRVTRVTHKKQDIYKSHKAK